MELEVPEWLRAGLPEAARADLAWVLRFSAAGEPSVRGGGDALVLGATSALLQIVRHALNLGGVAQ